MTGWRRIPSEHRVLSTESPVSLLFVACIHPANFCTEQPLARGARSLFHENVLLDRFERVSRRRFV